MFGAVKLLGDEPTIPAENGVWFSNQGDLLQQLPTETFSNFRERGSFLVAETEPLRQVRAQNAILRRQIFVLQEKFLVNAPGYICQNPSYVEDIH